MALRYLWFHVSSQAVLRIREVLPEKHPSRGYTQELGRLLDALGEEYSKYRQVGTPWGVPTQHPLPGCGVGEAPGVPAHRPCPGEQRGCTQLGGLAGGPARAGCRRGGCGC